MASDSRATHPDQSTCTRLKLHEPLDTNTVLICSSDRSSTMDDQLNPPLKKLKTSSIVSNGSWSSKSNYNSNITTSEGNCKALEDQPSAIAPADDGIEPGCETPKARENKIPEPKVCPPAPKKRRALSHDSYDHVCRRSKERSSDHPNFFSSSTSNSPSSTAAAARSSSLNSLSSALSATTNMATISSTSMQLLQRDYFIPPDLHALPENIQALFK